MSVLSLKTKTKKLPAKVIGHDKCSKMTIEFICTGKDNKLKEGLSSNVLNYYSSQIFLHSISAIHFSCAY